MWYDLFVFDAVPQEKTRVIWLLHTWHSHTHIAKMKSWTCIYIYIFVYIFASGYLWLCCRGAARKMHLWNDRFVCMYVCECLKVVSVMYVWDDVMFVWDCHVWMSHHIYIYSETCRMYVCMWLSRMNKSYIYIYIICISDQKLVMCMYVWNCDVYT